jgi:hypothetical protein
MFEFLLLFLFFWWFFNRNERRKNKKRSFFKPSLDQELKELEPIILDPKTDFVVVCSNCHRMLHRTKPVLAPSELIKRLSKPWNF